MGDSVGDAHANPRRPLSSTPMRMLVDPLDNRLVKAFAASPCKLVLVHKGIVSWESKPGLGEAAVEGLRHACLLMRSLQTERSRHIEAAPAQAGARAAWRDGVRHRLHQS